MTKFKHKTTRLPVPLSREARRRLKELALTNDWSEGKTASVLIEKALGLRKKVWARQK